MLKENKKRGKGKIKKPVGIREMYKFFCSYSKTKISYEEYSRIIKACNKEILKVVVKEAKLMELPYRLGALQICKFERSFNKEQTKWATDYKKSKELGFRVYHDQPFIYKWCWKKKRAKFIFKTGYKFTANRKSKRRVAEALRNKIDYFG